MKSARVPGPRWAGAFLLPQLSLIRVRLVPLLAGVAGLTPSRAETLYTLSGWIQPAAVPFSTYGEYVLMNDPLDRVRAILTDPDHRFVEALPARFRILAAITQPRGPGDQPVFRIVPQETAASATSTPDAVGSPGWTARTSDLYAAAMNVVPRRTSFAGADYPDADGDGTPDNRDDFPGRPEEWRDTDGDGTGNNADHDDDGDGMSDEYEILNGLNPVFQDANRDSDGDGVSNGEESIAGTLANDRTSFFRLGFAAPARDGSFIIQWQVLTTRVYLLETANTSSGPWTPAIPAFRPAADGVSLYTVPSRLPSPVFFRATVSAP